MSNDTITIPANWEIPNWCDPAPVPCTKQMLVRWMNKHHDVALTDDIPMRDIAQMMNNRYAPAQCPITRGIAPATWDVWAFIVAQEKRIRGGQRSLLDGMKGWDV